MNTEPYGFYGSEKSLDLALFDFLEEFKKSLLMDSGE